MSISHEQLLLIGHQMLQRMMLILCLQLIGLYDQLRNRQLKISGQIDGGKLI